MHFTRSVAALAVASFAIAAPVEEVAKKDFSITQVAHKKVLRAGPVAYQKSLAKFGAPVPAHVAAAAAAAAQQGSVTANPEQYDQEYLSPVQLSTGSQTLQLDFDTGSADLWVFSNLQPTSQTSGHTIYNPATSGKRKSGYTWNISYGDGSGAKGVVYGDKVVIGGVTATSQAVEAATSVSSQFVSDTNNDGLVGLAFSSINTVQPQQQTTFFDTVKSSLSAALFTVKLKYKAAGTYDFGYIDSSKYTGAITYSSINTGNGFWEFTYGGYSVGSTTYTGSFDAIADTGTSLILVDDAIVRNYYSKVSGASNSQTYGGYVFPCSATLPTFSIITNGVKHTVPGSYINYAPVSSSTCYGGIQSDAGIGFNILGDVFLKSQFVVFDSNGPRIGFANQS